MIFHGYEIIGDWENSTCGKIATATRGGSKFFLKKYQTPVAPIDNGTLDAKTYAHNKKLFEDFVTLRKTVNTRIRPLAGSGGNIVIPCEEFIDGNQYVEVSEFVKGAIPKDELIGILSSLSLDTKKLLMKTAAGALASIHSKGVVHSDLKLENLLLVRNEAGNYVAKMLDFDSSYPVDNKPDEIIGTIDYYSPELGRYFDSEDEAEEMKKYITEKTDIFSLGLIYHYYFVGAFPEAVSLTDKLQKRKDKGKIIYPWIVLNSGCELKISPEIKSVKYVSLISDMLSIDPKDRPTALEVLKRLQAPEVSDGAPMLEEPFPEHGIVLDKAKISAAKIAKLEKTIDGSAKKYKVMFSDGRKSVMTKEEMLSAGYAKAAAPSGFSAPWPEHNIEFDTAKLNSRGFVSSEKTVFCGAKGYQLYRADSSSTFFKIEMLLAMNYARKKGGSASSTSTYTPTPVSRPAPAPAPEPTPKPAPAPSGASSIAEPWPEHNIEFDSAMMSKKGYVGCARKTMGGVNGYEFVRADGARQFIRVEMVLIQRLARRK